LAPCFGARVAAIANSALRLEMAAQMGAHAGYLSDDPSLKTGLDEFTGGVGVDLVILTANPGPPTAPRLTLCGPMGAWRLSACWGVVKPPWILTH
jgi:D-arabinose 1-dehydrogenase-like Zn-dependent alcohol dehydrogenase